MSATTIVCLSYIVERNGLQVGSLGNKQKCNCASRGNVSLSYAIGYHEHGVARIAPLGSIVIVGRHTPAAH